MSLNVLEKRAMGLLSRGITTGAGRVQSAQQVITHNRTLARMLTDPENIGMQQKHVNFDTLGTWDNRIDFSLLLQQSIKHGRPIPKICVENIGTASVIGRRVLNEDYYKVKELKPNLLYFAVFDGHGGETCAAFCNDKMPEIITQHIEHNGDDNLELVLHSAFLDLDKAFHGYLESVSNTQDIMTSGSTATVCLLRDSIELVVGYVGDSRGYMCRDGSLLRLTNDHTAAVKAEKERIHNSQGFIKFDSSGRGLINGRLAMTRSLGDFDLKPYGVIATPDTRTLQIKHGTDAFVVISTDGITDVMNDREVINTVLECDQPHEAAKLLTEQALDYSCSDNATAVVVPFGAWGKYKNLKELRNTLPSFGRQLRNSVRF